RRVDRDLPLGRGAAAGDRVVRPRDLARAPARAHVCAGSRRMVVSHRHGVQVGAWAGRNGAGALADAALAGGAGRGADRDRTAPTLELVLYDFGAISASYALSIEGPLMGLPALAYELWGNERLVADARRHVEELMATVGDAAVRPRIADVVEDYSIFEIEAFAAPCPASALWTEHAHTVAQVLRAEPRTLSQQEVADATTSRLSFGPDDATFIDTDATLLFDAEGDDVRAVLEFANIQLLEMRFLDQQLDDVLERAYELLQPRPTRIGAPGREGPDLRRLARLQLDGAIRF